MGMTRNERPSNSRKNKKYASIFDFAEAAERGEEAEEEEYAYTRSELKRITRTGHLTHDK